jgi:FliI/YscN family ATPase
VRALAKERDERLRRAREAELHRETGAVSRLVGITMEGEGVRPPLGELCRIGAGEGDGILAEVVGFRDDRTLLLPLSDYRGVGPGAPITALRRSLSVRVGDHLLGRVLDGLGRPLDGGPPLEEGTAVPLERASPPPLQRVPIREPLPTGIRVLDGLLTCGKGQRIGIFSGSGVGKSTLLGAMARFTAADVTVLALIGERGREVREFLDHSLGAEGRARSVLVVATSDAPPLERLKGIFTAVAVAEHFRDRGKHVLFLVDSVTRFAAAAREVGLALGEPPTMKSYPPSFFSTMPRITERLGCTGRGSITGFFTVLVEGDDLNEPVADTLRGLLDGHVVLSRDLGNRGHYPAVDVLPSVSRLMPEVASAEHQAAAREFRRLLAIHRDAQDLIQIGMYKPGVSPELDRAVTRMPGMEAFLRQEPGRAESFAETVRRLREAVA